MNEKELYQKYGKKYGASELTKARNAARHRARYWMEKKYGKDYLRGKEIHHIKDSAGKNLDNNFNNLRIVTKQENMKMLHKRKANIRNF